MRHVAALEYPNASRNTGPRRAKGVILAFASRGIHRRTSYFSPEPVEFL